MNKDKAHITDELIHQISNVAVVRAVNLHPMWNNEKEQLGTSQHHTTAVSAEQQS